MTQNSHISLESKEAYINRELSWLSFARRVLELSQDPTMPLLERVKFVGIMGMIFDEFVMKRMGSLHQKIKKQPGKLSPDGHTPQEVRDLCWHEMVKQSAIIDGFIETDIYPSLLQFDIPLRTYTSLTRGETRYLSSYFKNFILPVLTPLAVDIGHPFPFISSLSLNVAITINITGKKKKFVRLKVPANRSRWISLPQAKGYIPLEEVIANNLHLLFPHANSFETSLFRVTRAAKDNPWERNRRHDEAVMDEPGSLIGMVTKELSYRKFAGIVRLEISHSMPVHLQKWLTEQLKISPEMVVPIHTILGCADFLNFRIENRNELMFTPHTPTHHPRLRKIDKLDSDGFFKEIRKRDILIHLPYHSFESSVLRLLQHAAIDPKVLAIKLTIYRTASDSPIIKALLDAADRGKQVAVLVEITARFDEAPNIAWGKLLERAGAHVVYGMERLKTHVKLAMVVREEKDGIKRYIHVGTGNYHTGTAKHYEDLGILSCHTQLGEDVGRLFNELTGAQPQLKYDMLMVAPHNMRDRFVSLIRQEVYNHEEGKPSGIAAKLNQLQDRQIIQELYLASSAGVPISLNIRGICCLRPGVANLSETIRVFSVLGRFLEHSRIYRFENSGDPLFFIGSADWMQRNLDRRMESVMPVVSNPIKAELEKILSIYESDREHSWEMKADGTYCRRWCADGNNDGTSPPAQEQFINLYKQLRSHP